MAFPQSPKQQQITAMFEVTRAVVSVLNGHIMDMKLRDQDKLIKELRSERISLHKILQLSFGIVSPIHLDPELNPQSRQAVSRAISTTITKQNREVQIILCRLELEKFGLGDAELETLQDKSEMEFFLKQNIVERIKGKNISDKIQELAIKKEAQIKLLVILHTLWIEYRETYNNYIKSLNLYMKPYNVYQEQKTQAITALQSALAENIYICTQCSHDASFANRLIEHIMEFVDPVIEWFQAEDSDEYPMQLPIPIPQHRTILPAFSRDDLCFHIHSKDEFKNVPSDTVSAKLIELLNEVRAKRNHAVQRMMQRFTAINQNLRALRELQEQMEDVAKQAETAAKFTALPELTAAAAKQPSPEQSAVQKIAMQWKEMIELKKQPQPQIPLPTPPEQLIPSFHSPRASASAVK